MGYDKIENKVKA